MKSFFISAALLANSFAFGQYCTSGGPTSTVDSNVQLVRIVGVGDSIHFVGCPGVLGVQNLTNLNVSLVANNTYPLSVQFGTCGGNYLGSGEVWIDFDQSGSFDINESVGTWTGTPPVPVSIFNAFIPAGAQNGVTRMRVMQREGSVAPPLDPCGAYQWGSVMDFSVTISGGVDCSSYIGDDTNDPIVVTSLPYTDNGDNSYCYGNQNHVYVSPDVYYLVIPSALSYSITATLCGSTFDTFLSVIDPQGNVLAYNDDAPGCAPQSALTVSTVGVDSIYFIVEGWGNNMGAYTLQLNQDFVGMTEITHPEFSLYPNPTQEQFALRGGVTGEVYIANAIGETVNVISNYNGETISTSGLASGVYFVRFSYAGILYAEKLIITQ